MPERPSPSGIPRRIVSLAPSNTGILYASALGTASPPSPSAATILRQQTVNRKWAGSTSISRVIAIEADRSSPRPPAPKKVIDRLRSRDDRRHPRPADDRRSCTTSSLPEGRPGRRKRLMLIDGLGSASNVTEIAAESRAAHPSVAHVIWHVRSGSAAPERSRTK